MFFCCLSARSTVTKIGIDLLGNNFNNQSFIITLKR